jgi:hypothetical protein
MSILSANPACVSSFFAIKLDIWKRKQAQRAAENGFFRATRSPGTPYILVSNTETLYSIVLYAKGVTNDSVFISRVLTALREFMEADGLAFAYDRFISPRTGLIQFASTFSRSVTGSMNELIAHGKLLLADEETSPFELGFRLNDTLLSAVESAEQLDYGKPRATFRALVARSTAP